MMTTENPFPFQDDSWTLLSLVFRRSFVHVEFSFFLFAIVSQTFGSEPRDFLTLMKRKRMMPREGSLLELGANPMRT